MIDELGRGRERRQERLDPPAGGHVEHGRARAGGRRGACLCRTGRQQLGEARIETDDGVRQMGGGEDLDLPTRSACVDLEEHEHLVLGGADVEAAARGSLRGDAPAGEAERVTEGRERLERQLRSVRALQSPNRSEVPVAAVAGAVRVVDQLQVVGPECRDGVGIAGREGGLEARGERARGVRAKAVRNRARGGLRRRRRSRRQLVEARVCLGRALEVEALLSDHRAVRTKHPEDRGWESRTPRHSRAPVPDDASSGARALGSTRRRSSYRKTISVPRSSTSERRGQDFGGSAGLHSDEPPAIVELERRGERERQALEVGRRERCVVITASEPSPPRRVRSRGRRGAARRSARRGGLTRRRVGGRRRSPCAGIAPARRSR